MSIKNSQFVVERGHLKRLLLECASTKYRDQWFGKIELELYRKKVSSTQDLPVFLNYMSEIFIFCDELVDELFFIKREVIKSLKRKLSSVV